MGHDSTNPQQGKQIIVQLAHKQNLNSTAADACWYNSSFTTHNLPRASRMERSWLDSALEFDWEAWFVVVATVVSFFGLPIDHAA